MRKSLDPLSVKRTETPSASYVLRRRYGPARHIIAAASWLTVFSLLFQPVAAWAATQSWNVQMTGGPHDWSTLGNWNFGVGPVPVAGDTANVNQNYTGALTIDIPASAVMQILNIGDSATTTLGGTDFVTVSLGSTGDSSLTFQAAGGVAGTGQINSQGGSNTVSNTLIMSNGLYISSNSGTLTVSGDIQGTGTVYIMSSFNATFPTGDTATQYTGVYRLPPTVADMNPGIVVFSGAKTFTGTLSIGGDSFTPFPATLVVNSAAAMGSNPGTGYIAIKSNWGVLGDGFGMSASDLAKINTGSGGALAITGNSSASYDFATPGLNSLKLGSTVLGSAAAGGATYSGTLTPGTGGYLLGGGGIATKLILANGVLNAAANATVSSFGIVQFGNTGASFAGAIEATWTGGTAYIPNGVNLTGATSLTTTGTSPTAGGAILLDPSPSYTGPGLTLNNGAIGWTGNQTITALPGTYSATVLANGTAGVLNVKVLHLGGTHSVGTMSQDGVYALQDDGGQAVELVKSGVQSTLDLGNAPSGGNIFSGGVHIASGTLLFSEDNQFGASGVKIVGNNTGILKLKAGSGAVSTSRILDPLDGGGGGGGGSPLPGFAIDVTSGDTLTFTGDFEKNNGTARSSIVKTGTGILEILPTTLVPTSTQNSSWGIGVRGGTVRLNQLPYVSSTTGGATGPLEFAANGTVELLAPPSSPTGLTNFSGGYGFSTVGVYNGATGTINVAANTILKNNGRTNGTFITAGSTLIVAGQGYANGSEFRWGRYNSGAAASSTTNGGTWDLRSIAFSFFGTLASYMPSQTDFTLKFNDTRVNGLAYNGGYNHNGNLVINDLGSATLSQIDDFTVTSTGNTSWRGTLEKIGTGAYGLTFSRGGGSATVAAGAALKISAGTVTAGGTADPFWDTANGRGVAVENNGTFSITTASKRIGALTGTGGTTVATGLTLTVDFNTDSAAYSGVVSGDGSVTKAGSGTWTLSNANTYIGATTVMEGKLLVNGTLASPGDGVTVMSGGALGGTGAINRNVGSETGSIFAWEAKGYTTETDIGTAGADYNQLTVGSGATFTLASGTLGKLYFPAGVNFGGTFWDSDRTWDVITGGSGASGGSIANADISVYVNGSLYDGGDGTISGEGAFSTAYVADGILRLKWTAASGLSEYDQWKQLHFTPGELNDPLVSGDDADPDLDGMTNLQEFLAGTDPRDIHSCLALSGVEARADGVVVSWSSETNRFYRIEMATNLVDGFEHTVETNIAATPPVNVYTDSPPAEAGSRFYRVRLE